MIRYTVKSSKIIIILVVIILIEALLIVRIKTNFSQRFTKIANSDLSQQSSYWRGKIQELGGIQAYESFKKEYSTKVYGETHSHAHIFGEVLYAIEGVEGIAVCDSEFGYGCYHGFLGQAIVSKGINILPIFQKACVDRYAALSLPCQHGIGHGILSYLGNNKLKEALKLCWNLSQQPTGGCSSGVFMEYNFHTMEDDKGVEVRKLENSNPYSPCLELNEKFQNSCYFEQVQWWQSVLGKDYKKIGTLCNNINKKDNQEWCFLGVGNFAAPSTDYDIEDVKKMCDEMPSLDGIKFCREGASWIFLSKDQKKKDALELCKGLGSTFEEACTRKVKSNPFWVNI